MTQSNELSAANPSLASSRTLLIGTGASGLQTATLTSTIDFYQFDTIIVEIKALARETNDAGGVATNSSIKRLSNRLHELNVWVTEGHSLIVVADSLWERNYTNSGRALSFKIANESPFSLVRYQEASGDRTEFCGPNQFSEFFGPLKDLLNYHYILSADALSPLLRVHQATSGKAPRYVSGYVRLGQGIVYFLPSPRKAGLISAWPSLTLALRTQEEDFPAWVCSLLSAKEIERHQEIDTLRHQIEEASQNLEEKQIQNTAYAQVKRLLFSTGEDFRVAVASALSELGLKVVDGPHPRADLLATDGQRLLAIEAKGVEGCIREQNITQAFRWLGEVQAAITMPKTDRDNEPDLKRYSQQISSLGLDVDSLDVDACRGLVCVATYRKTPLSERREQDFPDAVRRLITRPQYETIGAMTGAELLLSVLAVREQKVRREEIVQKLMQSGGVLAFPFQWQDYLALVDKK